MVRGVTHNFERGPTKDHFSICAEGLNVIFFSLKIYLIGINQLKKIISQKKSRRNVTAHCHVHHKGCSSAENILPKKVKCLPLHDSFTNRCRACKA